MQHRRTPVQVSQLDVPWFREKLALQWDIELTPAGANYTAEMTAMQIHRFNKEFKDEGRVIRWTYGDINGWVLYSKQGDNK